MKQKNFRFLVLAMLVCIGIGTWAIKAKSSGNVAKIGTTEYATFADALSAVQDGDVIYLLANADASSVAFTPCNGKKVIIAGTTGNEVLNMGDGAKGGISGTTEITFLNLKMQIRHTNTTGIWYTENIYHAGKAKYENVVFDGAIATADYVEFLNCTFASNPQNMEYTVWNYGGTQVFKGCTFKEESAGTKSFIKDYAEPAGALATNLVMAECTFNVPSPTPSGWKGSTIYFSTANSSTSKIYLDEQTKQAGGSISYSSGCDSKAEVCSSLEATGFTLPTPTKLTNSVAKIGNVEYASLAKAVAAAPTDGTETTIAMIDDETIEGNAGVTIAKGQNIILNLNGKTVKNLVNENKASQLITNNGTLKITGDGTMTNDLADGTIAGDWPTYNYATNLITNLGTLTIENGTFNNTQDSGITYTLDNNSNGVPATATINGGTFKSAGNAAVRMFCNSTTAANTLTINGGYFEGTYYAVSVSNASSATKVGSLTINGGEFESTADEYNACIANWESNKSSNIAVNITGGKFNDYVLVASNASVTGGTFKYDKYTDPDDGTVYDLNTYCAEGFELVQNADGTFGIEAKPAPAEEIKVAEELAITPTDGGSDLTTEQKAAATEAIETLVSNAEASTLPEETKESNTAAVNEEILKEGQSVVVDVVITGATVSTAGDNIVIKQVTFDVTPYVAENGKATDTEIENKDIEKPITFRLPVAASVTDTKAAVYHEGEPLGIKNIATGTDGSKYIEISSTEFSEFSYTLLSSVPAPATVKYYEGNSTENTGTIDDFVTAAATNKNAIAIVSSEYEDLAALYTNVIVDYAVGNGHYYECPNFVLTDLVDFYTPVAFVAVSGSYSRSNTAGKNSVCLPFAIDEEMLDAVKIGTFVSANLTGAEGEKTGSFYFRSNASVEAGTPCIVECSETVTSWNVVFNNTQIVAQPNNANALQGTFVEKEIGKDYFKVSEDGKSFVNSNEGSCNYPFRACVDLTNDSDFGFVKAINFVWEDEYEDEATTGISNVNVEKEANTAYDLSGRKAEKLVKGNIYIIKGKKAIIK